MPSISNQLFKEMRRWRRNAQNLKITEGTQTISLFKQNKQQVFYLVLLTTMNPKNTCAMNTKKKRNETKYTDQIPENILIATNRSR